MLLLIFKKYFVENVKHKTKYAFFPHFPHPHFLLLSLFSLLFPFYLLAYFFPWSYFHIKIEINKLWWLKKFFKLWLMFSPCRFSSDVDEVDQAVPFQIDDFMNCLISVGICFNYLQQFFRIRSDRHYLGPLFWIRIFHKLRIRIYFGTGSSFS